MYILAVVLYVLSLVRTYPILVRNTEEIERFRNFLETTKYSKNPDCYKNEERNETNLYELSYNRQSSPDSNADEISGKFEGDILLDDFMIYEMLQRYATGHINYAFPSDLWPHKTVIWQFADKNDFSRKQRLAIKAAIKDIEKNSCIKFRKRDSMDDNFVVITASRTGCYTHVGYLDTRGEHVMNIELNKPGEGCFRHGTLLHLWFHILGFPHMHARSDRDHHIKIIHENILPEAEYNFLFRWQDMSNISYDFASILHWSPYVFAKNPEETIIAYEKFDGTMGQRERATQFDWLRLNRRYKCKGAFHEMVFKK